MSIGEGIASSNQGHHDSFEKHRTVGFFTDPTLCIGCKACEVACKEWNCVPANQLELSTESYDNTRALGASAWRHVLFLEVDERQGPQVPGLMDGEHEDPFGWIFLSDVCKHCEVAGCLEACPTGAIVRTEVGAVVIQDDVCNGCGYCVVGCPFGVVDIRPKPLSHHGGAFKCTFCYDRQKEGLVPACAKACPTESIRFGALDDLRHEAEARAETLRRRGFDDVRVYDPTDTSVGGTHALFLLVGDEARYGLPREPDVPTVYQRGSWGAALAASVAMLVLGPLLFALF